MFTTKTINNKKAKKRMQNRTDNDFNYAQEARSQYDELVKQRSRVTSEKKIADLDEQIKDFMHVSEIRTYLKFANGPVIAQNVTFGKTNSKQEPTLYGFTCVLSEKGDTVIIPVNSTGPDGCAACQINKHLTGYSSTTFSRGGFMSPTSPHFTPRAKHAILSIDNSDDRVETILFLLQTAVADSCIIRCADVRSAYLMVEMRVHLLEGID